MDEAKIVALLDEIRTQNRTIIDTVASNKDNATRLIGIEGRLSEIAADLQAVRQDIKAVSDQIKALDQRLVAIERS